MTRGLRSLAVGCLALLGLLVACEPVAILDAGPGADAGVPPANPRVESDGGSDAPRDAGPPRAVFVAPHEQGGREHQQRHVDPGGEIGALRQQGHQGCGDGVAVVGGGALQGRQGPQATPRCQRRTQGVREEHLQGLGQRR